MSSSSKIADVLRKKGYRTTIVRTTIIELFAKDTPILSAMDVQHLLKKKHLPVNKTTVYRELDFLVTQGVLQQIELGDGKKRYELKTDHHHHIVCLRCDDIRHIALTNDLTEEEHEITSQTNFKIINHSLEFFGLCSACQKL